MEPASAPERSETALGSAIALSGRKTRAGWMLAAIPLVGIVVALVVIEVGFRLIFTSANRQKWNDRPHLYYKPTSAQTLQDYSYSEAKPAGTFRIVVAGDSFTFGPDLQFDDTFPKRLERMLSLHDGPPRVEVINRGVAGFSTRDEVNVVKQAASQQADLILLQITLNDPELELYRPKPGEPSRFGPLVITKQNHPLLYYWKSLGFVVQRLHAEKTRSEYKKYFFDLFEKPESWNNFKGSVEEIARVRDRYNIPVAAVVFPLISFGFDDDYPFFALHKKIADLAASLHIPVLDLFESYRGIPSERMQIIPGKDSHPNEIAHRIAAERIYLWLSQQKLIPETVQIRDVFWNRKNARVYSKSRCDKQPHLCFTLERSRKRAKAKEEGTNE